MPDRNKLISGSRGVGIDFKAERANIYSVILFACGLVIGSVFYKYSGGKLIDSVLELKERSFTELICGNICIYMAAFLVTLFLGLCIVGYYIIYSVPFIIGVSAGLKISYYLISFGVKGLGFSLLMLVPFQAFFMTVVCYTIARSTSLSKMLMQLISTENNSDKIPIKDSIKSYSLYGFLMIVCAFVNAGINAILFGIITI